MGGLAQWMALAVRHAERNRPACFSTAITNDGSPGARHLPRRQPECTQVSLFGDHSGSLLPLPLRLSSLSAQLRAWSVLCPCIFLSLAGLLSAQRYCTVYALVSHGPVGCSSWALFPFSLI